jgi:hypothetical protein
LQEHLAQLGAPPATTAIAIDRITEIIIEVRRGRRETAVGNDPELTALGLTRKAGPSGPSSLPGPAA